MCRCSSSSQIPQSGWVQMSQTWLPSWPSRSALAGSRWAPGPVHRQPHALEQVAVGPPLRLADGPVAGPGRAGVLVAAQPQLGLGVGHVPAQPVERVDLRCRGRDAAQHPGQRALDRLGQPELDERVEHERGIPDPAVPVVVVAVTAHLLGQRRGGGGRHGSRGRIGQQLEHERAAHHEFTVVALIGHAAGPLAPRLLRFLPALAYVAGRGQDQRCVVGRDERQQGVAALAGNELAAELAQARLGPPGPLSDQQHHQVAGVQDRHVPDPGPRPHLAEHRAGRNPPAHRYLTSLGPDVAGQLGPGERAVGILVERVDDPDHAVVRAERGLKHVGAGQVSPG